MEPSCRVRLRLATASVVVALLACGMGRNAAAQTRSILPPAQSFKKLAPWIGEYRSFAAGPAATASRYTVGICDSSGRAYVIVAGPMAELRMKAKALERRGKVNIYFDAYGAEDKEKSPYLAGDLLLTLKRKRRSYGIRWGILEPEPARKMSSAERSNAACSQASPADN